MSPVAGCIKRCAGSIGHAHTIAAVGITGGPTLQAYCLTESGCHLATNCMSCRPPSPSSGKLGKPGTQQRSVSFSGPTESLALPSAANSFTGLSSMLTVDQSPGSAIVTKGEGSCSCCFTLSLCASLPTKRPSAAPNTAGQG